MSHPRHVHATTRRAELRRRRQRRQKIWATLTSVLLALPLMATWMLPASADTELPEYLEITKRVTQSELQPGQTFQYTINVTCQEEDCEDAVLVDELPEELVGWEILDASANAATNDVKFDVLWSQQGVELPGAPDRVEPETAVRVEFNAQVDDERPDLLGMPRGTNFELHLLLKVPEDLAPGEYSATNEAEVSAVNAKTDSDSADIHVGVPVELGAEATKSWEPAVVDFSTGAESTITVGGKNSSNIAVDRLIVQEPAGAADGAEALGEDNPFTLVDFTGFTDATLPDGAQVQVDAYVFENGAWVWKSGTPDTEANLPTGVSPADVGGLRFTYTNPDGEIAVGAQGQVAFDVAQRATHRNAPNADLSADAHELTNEVSAHVEAGAYDPSDKAHATAPYRVTPAQLGVEVLKNFAPDKIVAGGHTTVELVAYNGGSAVQELRISEPYGDTFFNDNVKFAGFTTGINYPQGATSGTINYTLANETTGTVTFDNGDTPTLPAGVTGFEIVFTAPGDDIEPAAKAEIDFKVETTEDATDGATQVSLENTVGADVKAKNGNTSEGTNADTLEIIKPYISVDLDKKVRPSAAATVGDQVIVSLNTTAEVSDRAKLETITITDALNDDPNNFWNVFNLTAIAPTEVIPNTAFAVQVRDADGNWVEIDQVAAKPDADLYSLDEAEFAAKVAAKNLNSADLTGIQFVYTSEADAGFASGTVLQPNPVFEVRANTRIDNERITDEYQVVKNYQNVAVAEADGKSDGGGKLEDESEDVDGSGVIEYENGRGPVGIVKNWTNKQVNQLTGHERTTDLRWRVNDGFDTVTISDPADGETTPADTVFEAFDLRRIKPIAAANEPYSNGWFLKYDEITDIKLYDGTDWQTVPIPEGGWVKDGAFVGYDLSEAEIESTTGIQIVLTENTAAREAAHTLGDNFDPFAPAAGSGVGFGPTLRSFALDWQLRDRARTNDNSVGAWVIEDEVFNVADEAGEVLNSARIVGTNDADTKTDEDSDIIVIMGAPLNTELEKTADVEALPSDKESLEQGIIFVPDADSADRPTAKWKLTAKNTSTTPGTHLRVTDPVPCAQDVAGCMLPQPNTDPFGSTPTFEGSPFAYFDITSLNFAASIGAEVDLDASQVWLLRYDETDETFTTTSHFASDVNAMSAADLADVVGYSVTFQAQNAGVNGVGATITQGNEFTITAESVLRVTPRGESDPLKPGPLKTESVENIAFAQTYNDITNPDPNGALARKDITLKGGDINVGVSKAISPSEIVRANPDVPVKVTLMANQGTEPRSTLSPNSVVIEDHSGSQEFWNAFDFTALGTVTKPQGADRVQVDVYGAFNGAANPSWVTGEAAAEAQLPPSISAGDIEGIRFTFTRADGKPFDPTRPPAHNWNATAEFEVQLRDTYRADGTEIEFNTDFDNTVSAQSQRTDGINSEKKTTVAPIKLTQGTQEIAVKKLTNDGLRHAKAGTEVPFKLSFKNTGTGYLTITELRDELPAELVYLGTEPTFIKDDAGLLSDDVSVEVDGQEIIFTWPEGGNVMAPGEVFTIEIPFELQPTTKRVTNPMRVTTAEPLDKCGHIDGRGEATQPGGETTCATSDYVEVTNAANLFTVKGVQGSLHDKDYGGAYRIVNGEERVCSPALHVASGDYFRAPCIAHSEVGGSDDWVLHAQNAGTTDIYEMTIFDQLPTPGDKMLVAGNSRGSEFRPELLGLPEVQAPDGTEYTLEVTTSTDVCSGTWSGLLGNGVCEQAGETWFEPDADTVWADVTGIRVHLDFTQTAAKALQIGQSVDVTFQTTNVLQTDASPQGAPASVNTDDVVAWNQFGVKYRDAEAVKRSAPNRVGVHLRGAAIEIEKEVTGPAIEYAPQEFVADVQCSVGDVDLDMGDNAQVTLSADNDYRALIAGIPYSSVEDVECVVTEQGEAGSYGETSRSITPEGGVLTITEAIDRAADAELELPENQQALLTNTYDFTGLSVTKHVDTEATVGEFGPFDFELMCTSALGDPVTLGDDGETVLEFTLADGETFTAPENRIPVGAECLVTETDDFFADSRVFTGDNVTTNDDGTATVVPGTTAAEVDVYNGYDSGTLTVTKVVAGEGAERYGFGPFGFDAQCTYQGQELLNESFELEAGATKSFGIFPTGTECVVTETATSGATTTVLDPEDGTVEVVDAAADAESATVTATNTFDLGNLEIIKQVEGAGAELYGAGPFTAEVTCTWDRDGVEEPIALPNDGVVTLAAANDYRALLNGLLVGASCEVVETATGGANSTSVDPIDGVVAIPGLDDEGQAQAAVVTLTNIFDLTSLDVVKELRGDLTATGAEGPFEVELACLRDVDGESVAVGIPDGAVRELSAEGDFRAHYANLPLGAECIITEIEDGGAATTEITLDSGAEQVSATGTSLEFALDAAEAQYTAHVVNTFDPDPVDSEDPKDPESPADTDKPSTWLPRTGAEILTTVAIGFLFILAGFGLYRVRRNRTSE